MGRRIMPFAWGAVVVGTLGCFVTAAQPWWQVPYSQGAVLIPGTEAAAGLPQALGAVLAAGVLLALTLRGWGRRILAALLTVVGLAATVLGLLPPRPSDEVVARLVQAVTLDSGGDPVRSWGGYGFAAAGALTVAGAVGLLVIGRPSARGTDRFARPGSGRDQEAPPVAADADPLTVWRALDAGEDPTDAHVASPISPAPPDVGTMGTKPDSDGGRDDRNSHHA